MSRAIRSISRSISLVLAATMVAALLAAPASAVTPRAPVQRILTVIKAGAGSGTVTSNPGGIDCGATCSAGFGPNTSVILTATAGANSTFTGWSGGGCTGTGTCTLAIKADTTVTATFEIVRTVTVGKTGTGSGTVTSNPAGIDCGATCSATFPQGTTVTLTATPDVGSTFTGWSGACTGTASCVLNLTANRSVTATFTVKSYTLSVTKGGTGGGSVASDVGGINCGATCTASFDYAATVTLTATPDANSTFSGWSGAGCSGTGTCVVTMTLATSVTATFAAITHQLSVTKSGTGSGTVASSPPGIDCGGTCAADFKQGSNVTLTATPDADSTFTGWAGSGCSGTGTCIVAITTAKSVTANFAIKTYSLRVTKTGTGSGTVTSSPGGIDCGGTCSATYDHGTTVTLTASAAVGSTFTGWSGGGCGGTGTCVVTLTSPVSVTANFAIETYSLSVTKGGTGGGSVASDVGGINCGATCTAILDYGTTVTLTATPDANSTFSGWSDAGCSGTGTCVVTMTLATSVTATFTAITHQLSVTKSGTGSGTVTSSPPSIDCGATCAADFKQGSSVTLTASPGPHSNFMGWSGEGCSGTGTCVVSIAAAASVDAEFELKTYSLSVSNSGSGDGTVTSDVGGIDCGSSCSDTYDALTVVTLQATPDPNSIFTGWSGDCSGTGTCQLNMDGGKAATATFILKTFQVSVSKDGAGGGTVTSDVGGINCGATCSDTYDALTVVTLTAVPEPNSVFAGWSGDCFGIDPCVMTISSTRSVTATFDPIIHDVLVATTGAGGGTVTSGPAGIACGATCTAGFKQGSSVTLSALADPGSVFAGWSGDCVGTTDCVLFMDGPHNVSANFAGPRRVDGLVGVSGKPLKGAGIYNLTGAGQTQGGAVRPGKKKSYLIVIKNRGAQADRFMIAGEGKKSPFIVKYLVEGVNITRQVVEGAYRSPSLWSDEQLTIQMTVRAKKGAKQGTLRSWLTRMSSVSDPSRADAVKVNAKVKKKR